jgi:CDP-glycerol glycerophosphotransferase (TagB/SpsB family)
MSRGKSLVQNVLKDAQATGELTKDFWVKPLGKAEAVRREYIKYRSAAHVNRRVIFYETMSGARMGDNPYSVFEYLRSHPSYGEYLHVWSFDGSESIPNRYRDLPDVVFARRSSAAYAYFLAVSGRIVGNANLPGFFTRRPEQNYLNTWHGIPYKALGRDTPKARFGNPAGTATFNKATHVITPCEFMTDAVASAYSMAGVSNATITETGYPRVDLTLNPARRDLSRLSRIYGTDDPQVLGDQRPRVLYAPTWRAENNSDVVDTDQLIEDLKGLAGLDIQLMYRGHHRMNRLIQDSSVSDYIGNIIIPPHDISSNDLMTVVDILITDYSSIFFDFLPTGRPVVQYLYDLDEYSRTRGLNLGLDELPGAIAQTRRELLDSVESLAAAVADADPSTDPASEPLQGERYRRAQNRFCPHEDGNSSKRAVDFFINNVVADVPARKLRDARPTTAFWAGALPEGAESDEFLRSLIESGRSQAEQTVLIIDRTAPVRKGLLKEIKDLGSDISTISYVPEGVSVLPSEAPDYEAFTAREHLSSDRAESLVMKNPVLRGFFAYEYRRRLDDAQFDRVVQGPGLTNHELALSVFARKDTRLPSGKRVLPYIPARPIERVEKIVFPRGSARRRLFGESYRTVRKGALRLIRSSNK